MASADPSCYEVLIGSQERTRGLALLEGSTLEGEADEPLGDSRARFEADVPVATGWQEEGPVIEFKIAGRTFGSRLVAASVRADADRGFDGHGVLWELPGEGFSALRTLWLDAGKRGILVMVAARPEAADAHGEELVGAVRMIPGTDPYGYAEPLLSTEYDGAGRHVRATLELWTDEEAHLPERGAGLRRGGGGLELATGRLEAARFDWRIEGSPGYGAYEILSA